MYERNISGFFFILMLLGACSGDNNDIIPPFNIHEGIGIADLNNDTLPDIAVTYRYISSAPPHPGYVAIYLQDASTPGSFLTPTIYSVQNDPWALKLADLNADMAPDVIVVNTESNSVSVLFQQTGNPGVFEQARHFQTTIKPSGLTIYDIDADNRMDIAIGGYGGSSAPQNGAAILLQDAAVEKSFLTAVVVNTGGIAESISAADINNDGAVDLVVDSDSDIKLILQDPLNPMTFDPPDSLTAGVRPTYVQLADFDLDTHIDILVANAGNNTDGSGASISFLRQNPVVSGEFLSAVQFDTANGARTFALYDLNADNYPDLSVATVSFQTQTAGRVSVLLQDASSPGTILSRADYAAGFTPYFIDAGDLNDDGHPDLAVTDEPVILFQDALQTGTFNPPVNLNP
jgi:hypothetical protein